MWVRHLLAFALPVLVTVFLLTGPHPWFVALPWILLMPLARIVDGLSPPDRSAPEPGHRGPYDGILVALVVWQLVNIALLVRMTSIGGFFRADTVAATVVVGMNSGWSAIVVAHELVHRHAAWQRQLGRLLLLTVLYEHFATEHVRGHHVRVGTRQDGATARYGETFASFLVRGVPQQFRSAWELERRRAASWADNRVVQGLVAEAVVCIGIVAVGGPGALGVFALQAAFAVMLLEAVNWFEHWGLVRAGRKVGPSDSWDSESAFTLYSLVGLSRHADHHANPSKPYPELVLAAESPKLPSGYIGMVWMALFQNRKARGLLVAELNRRDRAPV